MKFCFKCKRWKLKEKFYVDKSKGDGLSSYCKVCRIKCSKENYHKKNPNAKYIIDCIGKHKTIIGRDELGRFIKGCESPTKGKKRSKEFGNIVGKTLKKYYKTHKHPLIGRKFPKQSEKMMGENNPNWKGSNVGRYAIHDWIRKHYGIADHCELCGNRNNNFDWCNIRNHKHERNINDYIQLCRSCHKRMDGGNIDIVKIQKLRVGIIYKNIDEDTDMYSEYIQVGVFPENIRQKIIGGKDGK